MMGRLQYEIQMDSKIANYFYERFQEYVKQNPEDEAALTFGAYLGQVVLGSLKSLFEGKVPEIYVPTKED